jgi:hypothetical protein
LQRERGVTCHAADHAKGICFAGFAEALESQFPKIAESQPEVLAHHCANAGQTEKASLLLGRAGQQSFARWAMKEAAEQLSRALGQIATWPGTAAAPPRADQAQSRPCERSCAPQRVCGA